MRAKINLYNEDCLQAMKAIADNTFDWAIIDPPYGIGMDNSNKRTKPSRPNSYTQYPDFRYHKTEWDNERPSKEFWSELRRVTKNQIVWGANYFTEDLPSGYGWIFWNKLNGENNCFSDGEFAFASKGVQSRYFECSAFDNLRGGKDRIHPTEKPVKLYKWLLENYTSEGDFILDTHLGSGSIAIACHDLKRNLTAYEIDPIYYDKACKRFNQHSKQMQLW